ncbi:MAG TPA: ATP-dependent DNA ligase [Microbacterium sp.]|uniref:DUF7882 family protein n=1 Tax=Microbacterium sp. TaxID=51671 RepID=UPI002B49F10F|nr:ATP-dependent DNA ligase [Microbacterium sp.]HKT56933.1 ATP-dependent DNA ligase [Microbacterium sp.]
MGRLTYDHDIRVEFEDRLLLHLQQVITNKLRRDEPFIFTWRDDPSLGDGRISVWIHAHASLTYKYYGSRRPSINREWLEALGYTANSPEGLHIVPEPAEELAV